MDSILGLQDNLGQEDKRSGGVWSHFEAEQDQGNSHLQYHHGQVLSDAAPADMGQGQGRET